jgi:O-antigen ligase/tetratricopeptide (TPR) repeat protein
MSQKTYLNILKFGSYGAMIVVFLVFKNLLFPFITSKQIAFNIIIEILFIFWIAFMFKYPDYRPKKHYTWIGMIAFFGIMVVSCFTGVDFNLSFWGDVERMLGTFHILHFLAYYFIIITVMRTWSDWKWFFVSSIAFASMVAINSITADTYATIGNSAYVAGYMLFNMYFCMILFFREKNKALRWLWLLPLLVMLPSFDAQKISGAYVGLLASLGVVLFLYGVAHKNNKIKIITLTGFILMIAFLSTILVFNRDNYLTENSAFFNKLVKEIDINKNTFQTRLVSWRAAIKDFPNHPLLGTGWGNYAVTFDKHFSPTFYDHARGETYFDRAHNNVFDILSTTGALGLITYLAFLITAAVYLIRAFIKKHISVHDFVMVSALMTAYFVQNLAVFDSLVTYMSLMIALGYVYWLTEIEEREFDSPSDEELNNKEIYAFVVAGIILLTILYQYNVKPHKMLVATIDGQRSWAQNDVLGMYENYKRALSYDTILDRDSRTSMIRLLAGGTGPITNLPKEQGNEILEFMIKHAKLNVEYNKSDSLNQMLYAQILNVAALYNRDNADKFMHYSDRAIEAINASVAATPGRTPVYFQKAQMQINRNDKEGALETLRYAASLNEKYEPAFCHLGRTAYYFKEFDEAYDNISKCLDVRGYGSVQNLAPASFIRTILPHYIETEDWERATWLYEGLAKQVEPKNPQNWIELAKVYADQGKIDEAREAAGKVIELDPANAQYAKEFIDQLVQ